MLTLPNSCICALQLRCGPNQKHFMTDTRSHLSPVNDGRSVGIDGILISYGAFLMMSNYLASWNFTVVF